MARSASSRFLGPASQGRIDARRPIHVELVRYFVASALALGLDVGLYSAALAWGAPYPLAACLGFVAGAGLAYGLSVRWVFESRCLHNAGMEFAVFVAVGLGGLLLTEALLWLMIGRLGLPPVPSKLAASGLVFMFNFSMRKLTLFKPISRRG